MFYPQNIRELREKLGWSRHRLASYLHVADAQIIAWEDGRLQPNDEQLGALYRLANSHSIPFDPFRPSRPTFPASPDPFLDARLKRVKTLVEGLYTEPISLGEAATAACLERKYFSKFFHKSVGVAFSTWLCEFRIEKAKELLVTTDEHILDIAYRVGFQSIRTFERRFKRLTGLTPQDFRRKRRTLS